MARGGREEQIRDVTEVMRLDSRVSDHRGMKK
jgi:hypothetical protein